MTYDAFIGRNAYACRRSLEKTQWMKKRDLQRLQAEKMKALLTQAYENVPYYRKSFKEYDFHPSDFHGLMDLNRIPILKKAVIREEPEKLMAKNVPKWKMECWETSGTTAAPLHFYRSKVDVSWGVGAELRGYSWAGYEVGDKLVWLWRVSPQEYRSLKFKLRHSLARTKILNVSTISEKSMASFAHILGVFQPDYIRGYAGSTNIFATFMLENSHFRIQSKAVFTTGETLIPHYRRTIEEAFKCKVYDIYGTNEFSHAATQCGHHSGLHVNEENVILEIIKDNEPASPEIEGKVLLTNLNNYAMPFIRYDIGDTGVLLADTCPCGRNHSLFKPHGRTYEYFFHSDGSFTILRDLQTVLEDLPIKDFQVVQESHDQILIKIVCSSEYTSAHTDFILENIRGVSSPTAEIKIELVDSIMPEKSGKVRHAVSKLSTKYT